MILWFRVVILINVMCVFIFCWLCVFNFFNVDFYFMSSSIILNYKFFYKFNCFEDFNCRVLVDIVFMVIFLRMRILNVSSVIIYWYFFYICFVYFILNCLEVCIILLMVDMRYGIDVKWGILEREFWVW